MAVWFISEYKELPTDQQQKTKLPADQQHKAKQYLKIGMDIEI
jgi:hypothetical protein